MDSASDFDDAELQSIERVYVALERYSAECLTENQQYLSRIEQFIANLNDFNEKGAAYVARSLTANSAAELQNLDTERLTLYAKGQELQAEDEALESLHKRVKNMKLIIDIIHRELRIYQIRLESLIGIISGKNW